MVKQFAFFLPQFHRIPENDEWWGKGFTEWTNVKKAKKLYDGHRQPKLPLNDNYYNLLDKETVIWQTELMNKYHVDGLIYYHYYFKGKKLLEKPAENLLKWKDINQPFFFCWANHTWYRSWEGSKKVLILEEYGDEKDWEEHFNYLLPFFLDERYEKRNNKPLFMIFESDFPEKDRMFRFFDKKCKEAGFDGICLIETWNYLRHTRSVDEKWKSTSSVTSFLFTRESSFGRSLYWKKIRYKPERIIRGLKRRYNLYMKKSQPAMYDGDVIYEEKILHEFKDERIIHGTFFEWDNTPRHGRRGYVITPPSKEMFMRYMDTVKDEEYIFINAWNEWAEGMMLEPTKEDGYKYLEWIAQWVEKNSKVKG